MVANNLQPSDAFFLPLYFLYIRKMTHRRTRAATMMASTHSLDPLLPTERAINEI